MRLLPVAFVAWTISAASVRGEAPVTPTRADEPVAKSFSPNKGAEFLDGVNLAWTRERKCATCHTNVFFMHARPHLSAGGDAAMKEIRTFLEGRAEKWEKDKPRADYEVLATAMALAGNDAATTKKLHPLTKKALDWSWTLQKPDGSWKWPACDWPPLEHDQYYGVVFMAIATGIAPEGYAKSDTALAGLTKIRQYLKANSAPDLHHRMSLLWASTMIDDLMTADKRKDTIKQLRDAQREDGGWSLPSLGNYMRHNKTANDPTTSDGYGTGYSIFVLRQAGVPAKDPAIQKGVKWLLSNQRESGRWFTRSLSNDKAHYITNAGSAFAVLALAKCDVPLNESK